MDRIDTEVLQRSVAWLDAGRRVTLVTVTRTLGSAPRPVGSLLGLADDGQVCGSVSGGCVEDDLIAESRAGRVDRARPSLRTYGLSADEAHRFGLPCGGTIQLVLEPLRDANVLRGLLESAERRELVAREVDLDSGASWLSSASRDDVLYCDGRSLRQVFGPRWRLLLIGAGQLSRCVAQVALGLDFEVSVCDPRVEYSTPWSLADVPVATAMPDDTVLALRPDIRTAVVTLTHDPKLDDLALMEALRSNAFYVGAIGSRTNTTKRRERLALFDLSAAQIDRLRAPVGLDIGSRTPPEIAISVLAEIIAVKNGRSAGRGSRSWGSPDRARSPNAPDAGVPDGV